MRLMTKTTAATYCGLALGGLMLGGLLLGGTARADFVPPFKGNDTGGIISPSFLGRADIRAMAGAHCAQYGKMAKFLSFRRSYGDYISFACRWVPYGRYERPLRVRY